jgi:hypothetical protein
MVKIKAYNKWFIRLLDPSAEGISNFKCRFYDFKCRLRAG